MAFWSSSNFPNNRPNSSPCWSVCSLSPIHNCLFRQPVIKVPLCRRDRPGRELITSSLPCTWQISPNLPPAPHTPTQWGEGESRSIQHQSQALSPSYSLGALLMLWWSIDYISVSSTGSQESNIERKQGWRNQKEIMICMKSRVMMIIADRKENEACSEKSMSHWIINSIRPCVEAPEGLMGLYVFLSKARRMEHPCLHAYSICSPCRTCFRLGPPPHAPWGQRHVLGSNVSLSPGTVSGTLSEFSE